MAKQLNIDMSIRADTSQAKKAMMDLQKNLDKVLETRTITINDQSINNAKQAAMDLKRHLAEATNVNTGKIDLSKFSASLSKSGQSLQGLYNDLSKIGPTGQSAFLSLAQSIAKADASAVTLGSRFSDLMTTLKNTAKWQISSSLLHGFIGTIQGAYHYAQDLNESLNNIRIVTGQTTDQMAKFAKEANNAAKSLSTTTTAYTDAALIYYQQGLSDEEVKARTDTTIKLANVSRQSAEEVSSQMTAIWNNFAKGGENLEYYADVITALGAATASSSDEIAEGLSKFASVADTVGLSYEKASAALATVVAETRQSADVVGTAFKTIFARIQGLNLGETLEDGVDLNKYSKALQSVGVNVLDSNKELKDMDIILDELSKRWDNIGEAQKVALSETVAGVRQYSQFMALMNNYDKIQTNEDLAEGSGGTLQDQADIYAESWEGAQKRVQAALQEIYDQLLNDDAFINILNGFEKFIGFISNIIDGLGGVKGILLLIGTIFMNMYAKEVPAFMEKMITNVRILTGAEEKRRQVMLQENADIVNKMSNSGSAAVDAQIAGTKTLSFMYADLAKQRKNLSQAEIEAAENQIKEIEIRTKNAAKIGEEIDKIKEKAFLIESTIRKELDSKQNGGFYNKTVSQDTMSENEMSEDSQKAVMQGQDAALGMAQDKLSALLKQEQELKKAGKEVGEELTKAISKAEKEIDKFSGHTRMTGKDLFTAFKNGSIQLGKMQSVLLSVGNKTSGWDKELKQLVKDGKETGKITKEMEEYIQAAKKAGINTQDVEEALKEFQEDGKKGLEPLINAFKELSESGGLQFAEELDMIESALVQLGADSNKLAELKSQLQSGAISAEQYKAELEALADKVKNGFNHNMKLSEGISKVATAAMQTSMAIQSLIRVFDIWNDEDLSAGEKALQIMTALGMAIPTVISAYRMLFVEKVKDNGATIAGTIATGAKTVATKIATAAQWALNIAMESNPIGAVIALVVALIAALTALTFWLISAANAESAEDKAIREANESLEEAKKVAKELADAAKEAKDKADKLKEAFDKYDTIVDKLNSCKKGTQEWRDTLDELNTQVRDMVAEYPELLQYLTELNNGAIGFSEEGQEEVQKIYNRKARQASNTAIMAQADVEKKNVELEQKKLIKSSKKIDSHTTSSGPYGGTYASTGYDSTADQKKAIIENADDYSDKTVEELKELFTSDDFENKINLTGDALTEFVKQVQTLGNTIKKTDKIVDNAATTIARSAAEEDFEEATDTQKDTIANLGEAAYTEKYNKVYDELIQKNKDDYDENSWDEDLNSNQDAIWHRWLKAMGLEGKGYHLDKDALNGSESKRTVTFYDENGKKIEKSYDLMAKEVAAGEAETEMSDTQKDLYDFVSGLSIKGQNIMSGMEYKSDEEEFDFSKTMGKFTDVEREELAEAFKTLEEDSDEDWEENMRKAEKGELAGDDEESEKMQQQYQRILELMGMTADQYIEFRGKSEGFDASKLQAAAEDSGEYSTEEANVLQKMNGIAGNNFIRNNKTYDEKMEFTQSLFAAQDQIKNTKGLENVSDNLNTALDEIIYNKGNIDNFSGLTAFQKGLKDIDLTSDDASEKIEALAKANNINGQGVQNFIDSLKRVEHHFDLSSKSINEQRTELQKLTKDMKIGDSISEKDLETLQKAGINTDAYFTRMADGTYQLTTSADEFKKAVDSISIDKLRDKIKNIYESRVQTKKTANNISGNPDEIFSNTAQEAKYGEGKAITGANMVDAKGALTAEGSNYVGARLDYAASFYKDNPELFADLGDQAQSLLENAGKEGFVVTNPQDAELISKMIDKIDEQQSQLQQEYLSTATTLSELKARTAELGEISGSVDYSAYAGALINLSSQYENTTLEIEEYEDALRSGDTAQVEAAENALVAATMIGEAAAKYGLVAEDVETQAKLIAKNYSEANNGMEMNAQTAARLAIANQRMNKGVKNLHDNWKNWSAELKKSNHTTKDYAETLNDANEALADLVGAVDGASIPIDFLDNTTVDGAKHLEWMSKAAEGDTKAINQLGVAVAKASLKEMKFSKAVAEAQKTADELKEDTIEPMTNAFGEIITEETFAKAKNIVNEFMAGFENAVANGTNSAQSYLDNYGEDWVSALNEMAIATAMSVDEMNALLNQMGVDVQVDTTEVQQKTKVPKYTTVEGVTKVTYHPDDKKKEHPLFEKESYTYQSGTEEVTETIEVPQINTGNKAGTPPKVNYVGTSASSGSTGGVSSSSTANSGSSSSAKNTSAASHEHSVNRYSDEENAVNGLSKQYERLEKAKDKAFGVSRVQAMEKELSQLKKLKKASGDYLEAISGKGNADKVAKAIYNGGDIGAMIANGSLGGTIASDYKSLYGGTSASGKRLEYAAKDSAGNEYLVEDNYSLGGFNSLFGANVSFNLDQYGNLQNKDSLLNLIQNLTNQENSAYSSVADPDAASTTEHNKRLAYLAEIKERIDQYGSTAELLSDKADEYLDYIADIQEKNAELITAKMDIGVELGKKTTQRIERITKVLGDSIYKSTEAMSTYFGAVMDKSLEATQQTADSYITAFQEVEDKWRLFAAEGGEFNSDAINSADAAELLSSIEDGLDAAIDELLGQISTMKEYYGNMLSYWNSKLEDVNSTIQANVKTLEHFQNVLNLLGRTADYKALGEVLKAQLDVSQADYNIRKKSADAAKEAYDATQKVYDDLKKSGVSEDALEAYYDSHVKIAKDDYFAKLGEAQSALETTLQKVNAWFENEVSRIFQESEDRLTGEWGSFDALDSAMQRQKSVSEEYLTKTNQLYETNTMLRKLSQDIDKTDSQIAKNKLKAFSDEIESMKTREKLSKTDLDIAKARYEVLKAQIALEEAQNAKSTVRLQRDNEGNYGYVYTADADKISDAEATLEEKQNALYNLGLQNAQNYSEKLVQIRQEYDSAIQDLVEKRKDGLISAEEYEMQLADINTKYRELEISYTESYIAANQVLNEVGAEGQVEAWNSSFDDLIMNQQIFNDESLKAQNELSEQTRSESERLAEDLDDTLNWLNNQRAYYTEDTEMDNEGLKRNINTVTSTVQRLEKETTGSGGLVDSYKKASLAAIDLTSKYFSQYDAMTNLIKKYADTANKVNTLYTEVVKLTKAQQDYNQSLRDTAKINYSGGGAGGYGNSGGGSGNGSDGFGGGGSDGGGSGGGTPKTPTRRFHSISFSYDAASGRYWPYVNYTEGGYAKNVKLSESFGSADEVAVKNSTMFKNLKKSLGFKSGGYTGTWDGLNLEENGKLAFLHQKELVLNTEDTENILDAVKLIRQISQTIDLQAMAYNNSAFGLAAAHLASNNQTLQQEVTIHAEFPNATDHNEIEEAFNNLVNRASQYANRY